MFPVWYDIVFRNRHLFEEMFTLTFRELHGEGFTPGPLYRHVETSDGRVVHHGAFQLLLSESRFAERIIHLLARLPVPLARRVIEVELARRHMDYHLIEANAECSYSRYESALEDDPGFRAFHYSYQECRNYCIEAGLLPSVRVAASVDQTGA